MAGLNKGNRPTGISALAILELLGGVLAIILGLFLAGAGSSILGGLGPISGIVAIISGLFAVAVGYGFWTGAKWSWWLAVILYIFGIIFSLASVVVGSVFSIVGLIIDALLLYYLTRPGVKSWFSV
jgi:hypothetical protein